MGIARVTCNEVIRYIDCLILTIIGFGDSLTSDGDDNFIGDLVFLPLCIENVGFNIIHAGGRRTGGEASAMAVFLGVPASKRVALAFGKQFVFYQFIIREKINEAIIL